MIEHSPPIFCHEVESFRLHLWHKNCILYQRAVEDLYNSSLNFPFFYFSYLFGFSSKLSSELFISLTVQSLSTIILIIFWDFLMFCQVFLLPLVKRSAIFTPQFQIIVPPLIIFLIFCRKPPPPFRIWTPLPPPAYQLSRFCFADISEIVKTDCFIYETVQTVLISCQF